MTVEGSTAADVFRTFVKRVLGPTLRPGAIVVMADLRAPQAVGVAQARTRRAWSANTAERRARSITAQSVSC
jgi:hypothetical protein